MEKSLRNKTIHKPSRTISKSKIVFKASPITVEAELSVCRYLPYNNSVKVDMSITARSMPASPFANSSK